MDFGKLVNPVPSQDGKRVARGSSQSGNPAFLHGHQVVAKKSDQSLVQDALEELAMGSAERQRHYLKNRKTERSRPQSAEEIQKYLEHVEEIQDFDKEKYLDAGDKQDNLAQILNQDDIHGDDATQKFLGLLKLLQQVRGKLSDETGNERLQRLEQDLLTELGELEHKHGAEIRAGINIDKVSNIFAGAISPKALRAVYKETILDYASLSTAYGEIIKRFGSKRFAKGLAFLLKAVAADLHAAMPSLPKNQLARIIEDMFTLKVLASLHERCEETMARLFRRKKDRNRKKHRHHPEQSGDSQEDLS